MPRTALGQLRPAEAAVSARLDALRNLENVDGCGSDLTEL